MIQNTVLKNFKTYIPKSIINVVLAGIGMGDKCGITENVKNAIANADLIFGAKRMIESAYGFISNNAKVYQYYLAKDIIPVINENALDVI